MKKYNKRSYQKMLVEMDSLGFILAEDMSETLDIEADRFMRETNDSMMLEGFIHRFARFA